MSTISKYVLDVLSLLLLFYVLVHALQISQAIDRFLTSVQ